MSASRTPARPLSTPSGPVGSFFAAAFIGGVRLLSGNGIRIVSALLGNLAYVLGIRRRITLGNLRRAFPELTVKRRRAIARGAYVNMARTFLQGLAPPLKESISFENWNLFEEAIAQKKGVLVASAHLGSWESCASLMASRGLPLNAVVRPLKGNLNGRLMQERVKGGIKLIAARGALGKSMAALRRGEVVAMLLDQVMPAKQGVFVPFFGWPASTSPALSIAALRTGAPVLVVVSIRECQGLRVLVQGPFPLPPIADRKRAVVEHTAQVTAALEGIIRKYPEQWLWLHRRWKVQPEWNSGVP